MVNSNNNYYKKPSTRIIHTSLIKQKTTKAKADYEEDLIKEEKKFQEKQLKERESKITS